MFKKFQANLLVIVVLIVLAAVAALVTGIPYETGFGWQIAFWMFGIPFCVLAGLGIVTIIYSFCKGFFPEMHGENPYKFR